MEMVGFVPEPNCGRGTIGILWSCFSTLFLSIWVSVHPEASKPGSTGSWLFQKAALSLILFLVPEAGAVMAIDALFLAQRLRKDMHSVPGWEKFSLKQTFLVSGVEGVWEKQAPQSRISENTLVSLARSGRLSFHDFPTDAEIDDRSKSNGLLKVISISQTIWFMVNLAYRVQSGHQAALLEDITAAHAFCGLVMFIGWFRCPQDVHGPFSVSTTSRGGTGPREDGGRYQMKDSLVFTITVGLFAIFAGIHVAAWNYPYATAGEAWIWRICSVLIFGFGIVISYDAVKNPSISDAVTFTVAGFYTIIRLALIVVAFMSFRSAPAALYEKPTWTAYWIHLG